MSALALNPLQEDMIQQISLKHLSEDTMQHMSTKGNYLEGKLSIKSQVTTATRVFSLLRS